MGTDLREGSSDSLELAELRDTARRLQRQTPRELSMGLRFRQVRESGQALPEVLLEARRSTIAFTDEQLRRHGMPDSMVALIAVYLEEIRAYAEVAPYLPPVDFPTATHVTACGRALPTSVGAALLCSATTSGCTCSTTCTMRSCRTGSMRGKQAWSR